MADRKPRPPVIREDKNGRVYIIGLPMGFRRPGAFDARRDAKAWLAARAEQLAQFHGEESAQSRRQVSRRQVRACMCCRSSFESQGPHNRLCDPCRRRGSAEGQDVGYSFGAMTGRRKSA